MIRVYKRCCGWYFQWRDKKSVLHERGPWVTKEEADAALQSAMRLGIIE